MSTESALPSVTFGVKVTRDDGPGGHVHFDLFAGRNPHARGRSGSLVLRHDEFHAFLDRLQPEASYVHLRVRQPEGCPCIACCQDHGAGGENTDG